MVRFVYSCQKVLGVLGENFENVETQPHFFDVLLQISIYRRRYVHFLSILSIILKGFHKVCIKKDNHNEITHKSSRK